MYLPERYLKERKVHYMKKRFKKLSHTIYECKYHVVWCPKYRYRIFSGEIVAYVRQQLYQLSGQKEQVEILELNIRQDHIHLVIEIAPKYAVSAVIGYLKGKVALKLFQRYEKVGEAPVVAGVLREYGGVKRGAGTQICAVAGEAGKRTC